jgi:hypothetical protein
LALGQQAVKQGALAYTTFAGEKHVYDGMFLLWARCCWA